MLKSDLLRTGRSLGRKPDAGRSAPAHRAERTTPTTADTGEPDAEIVVRAKRDPAAFAPLYARHAGPVHGYCLRRLRDREAAEDATSLVFLRVLGALPRCRAEQFRPWLFGIAHNVTTDALRARTRAAPLPEHDDRRDPTGLPDDLALDREGDDRVRALLATLNPVQRQIVELRLAGLTGAEIAAVLGRSHGAIRVAPPRAYRRLREVIAAGG